MNKLGISPCRLLLDRERLRVALFLLFAICVLAVSLTFFTLSISKPYMGIVISKNDLGWEVTSVDSNGLASQAGLREGDNPIVINGQPAPVFLEKYENAGSVIGVLIKDISVIDENGETKSVVLQDNSPSRQSSTEVATWFIVCVVFWITGFYVFFKKPSNQAALLLCLCGITFGLMFSGQMAGERLIPTALWFSVIASTIGPWLLLHFFLVLPEERTWLRTNNLVYLIYVPAVITLILFPVIGYADSQPLPGFRTARLLEFVVAFIAIAGVVIFNYLHSASQKTRQQMKIVLISCFAALVPFVVLSILPEIILGQPIIPVAFSVLFIIFIPLGMGYAVITQKLMDIDIFVRRGVVYSLITMLMTTILGGAIFIVLTFQDSLGVPEEIGIALALGILATILFGLLKRAIETLIDQVFYKDRYDYRQIIQSLSNSLNSVQESTDVSRLIVGTTVNTLNLVGGCLFIKSQSGSYVLRASQGIFTNRDMQEKLLALISQRNNPTEFPNSASEICTEVAFLIPLVTGERELGIILLSQKISRQDFSPDDIYLLQGIASVAAIALHSAMLIQDVSIRDTFVSIASHELRTPLTSIMGYAELLLSRDPPDTTDRKRWLKNIFDSTQRISTMVDDLLNVSRIHSGKFTVKRERVQLPDVLKGILSLIEGYTDKHEFFINVEPGLPDMQIDRDKFSQVIGNLLSNAIKYSPSGGGITLSVRNDKERNQIVASVTDEGIGISQADKEQLFTTFHRIKRPETQGIRGSGLGLYIAKEWTQAMGGKIWLESELNKGSTFYVSIPTNNSNSDVESNY